MSGGDDGQIVLYSRQTKYTLGKEFVIKEKFRDRKNGRIPHLLYT